MQTHRTDPEPGAAARPDFIVTYRIRVRASNGESAKASFFDAVCGGDQEGPGWEVVVDYGIQAVEVVNPDVDWSGGFKKE